MNFLRALLASLLSLACTLAVSGFVTLQTFNSTLLDRAEVKTWLSDSGVYNNLLDTVLASNATVKDQVDATGTGISPDTFKLALVQTFPASFVQQSTEKVLDGAYNWLDSKASNIQFEIDTTSHKETFVQKLSALLEPQLATMPRCTSLAQFNASNPTCLPPGTTAKQAADAMSIDASNRIGIFSQPLTTQNVSDVAKTEDQDAQTPANPSQQLPTLISTMRMWLIWLPLIALVSGGLMVLLSRLHLRAAKHLAGRLTFGLAVTFALGLIVANVGKTLRISDYYSAAAGSSAVTTNVAEPILHQAAPAMGNYLAMVSGIAGAITLVLWIILRVVQKRHDRAELLKPLEDEAAPKAAAPTTKPAQTSTPSAPQSQPEPASPPKDEQK
jgi:hypothetical protein